MNPLDPLRPAVRSIAIRMEAAYQDFLVVLQDLGGISREDAIKVAELYRKAKVTKMDAVSGRLSVKHGAFLDRENILHALSQA